MMSQTPSKQAPWDLTQFFQLPSAALLHFPEFHRWSEISSFSKVILVLGKASSHRAPNMGYSWAESPGWFDVLPNKPAPDVMHERVHCCDETANHPLPIVATFWIIKIVFSERSSLMQNLMQIRCSTCSVIWMWWPHSTHAHSMTSTAPLTSTAEPSLFTHVHSSPLSLAARLDDVQLFLFY